MVYRKKTPYKGRRRFRKRTYAKKKIYRKRAIPNGFPVRGSGLVRLQMAENFTVSPTGTAIASKLYRLNSIWSADFTSGQQPMYHDQLATLYNHYKVLGVRMRFRITALGNNASTEYPILVGFCVRDDSTLATDMKQEIENGRCKTVLLTSSEQPKYIEYKWSAKKFFGKERYDDEATGAAFGASPTEQAWGHFIVKAQNTSAATPNVYADLKMEFIVQVGEPKKLGRS